MKNPLLARAFAFALTCVLLTAFWSTPSSAAPIVVGGKNFTEQQLMTEITTQLLEAKGFEIVKKDGMGSAVLRQAQENGQIDLYWEYTGTSLITYNKVSERLSPEDTYRKVKELDAAKGLVWLNPSRANNTYSLAMNADEANKQGIVSISDLAQAIRSGKALRFACNSEFYARPDGLRPLEKSYGFDFARAQLKRMDTGLTYQALKDRQVDIALVFATDGRVPAFNFVILKDDKGFFPSYALTPVVRKAVLDANPSLAPILNALSEKLDAPTMARLNASVDVSRKSLREVARDFLTQSGLIG
ncbi:glycine betaine ABC transporter substrate-binding protein [Verminephrobacter eiseniae]|uniref:glycine betaine ABC transporter substrate-binding protein n=1 Tax=Verminephrobacter eiseniae TaxID=364317 RepID=UPI0010F3C36D|nr:glycine betaine ABC transporter substrate-binding protein [Verminephrobacter eiseniae]KAB7619296.1 glycine betaine ABC transporter substrate-binding protein [Verminephrobacter sp. Larva24]MCW5230045.1 glycine betaine ABC transporter substrate-binding protein [Verminephrobacter eiseniae]MCW5291777.1 glycine betaine ABC transporter substrate-binding protein [Verminephrobacter eiseniae]MCW8186620.1 glycine betaine ABC transporter substrate-binding protein [Verminephrobacter eiseniae]MCW8225079